MGVMGHGGVAVAAAGALVAAVPGTAVAGTSAAEVPGEANGTVREEHCVLHIVGQAPGGRFLTDELVCYPTLAEALGRAGAPVGAELAAGGLTGAEVDTVVGAASGTLAVHYDGANRTGSSITISGGDCNGGYVNLSSSWINRISSTSNTCAVVNFWDGYDKTGSYEGTNTASVNLGSMNNAANSVGYA